MSTKVGFLRPKPSAEFCGIAISTLWEWVSSKPEFPRPIPLSGKCTVFSVAELDAYVKSMRVPVTNMKDSKSA